MITAQKKVPPVIENPEEQLKKINKRIAMSYEIGKADNESSKEYNERIASYFDIKRRCIQQIQNGG